MKTTYLKRMLEYPNRKGIQAVVKITNKQALHCCSNSIEVDGADLDDTDEYWITFYESLRYIDATKEEFDTMLIEAVKLINELSKI